MHNELLFLILKNEIDNVVRCEMKLMLQCPLLEDDSSRVIQHDTETQNRVITVQNL